MKAELVEKYYKEFKLKYQDSAKFGIESEILTPEPDERPNMPPIEFIHRDPNAMWWNLEEQYKLSKEQIVDLIIQEKIPIDHFVHEKLYCGHVVFYNKKDIE
jgi:hypothetical protein